MFVYLLFFFVASWFALVRMKPISQDCKSVNSRWSAGWLLTFLMLLLLIGLRYEVGGDWFGYSVHLDNARNESLIDVIQQGDPAYMALNWFGANVFGGIYFVNIVCAGIFGFGLIVFCKSQSRPWLALVIAVPYLITVVAMGYTRQGVAIGLAMLGLVALMNRSILHFLFWIAIAAMFHKSAVILVPLAVFSGNKNRFVTVLGVVIVGLVLFALLLQEALDRLTSIYIDQEYESSGAAIRVFMNALPAAVFLLFRRRFKLSSDLKLFWTWMSLFAISFLPLLMISPSSTAVDRVALYFIPIQLFVWSRLPDVLGVYGGRNPIFVLAIIFFSGLVLVFWLAFANNAHSWVPYQWLPWILLTS